MKRELEINNRKLQIMKIEMELMRISYHDARSNEFQSTVQFGFRDVEDSMLKCCDTDGYTFTKWKMDIEESSQCLKWNNEQKLIYAKSLFSWCTRSSLKFTKNIDSFENLVDFFTNCERKNRMMSL